MTSAISMRAAMSSFRGFMLESLAHRPGSAHPDEDTADDHAQRQERLADPNNHFHFAAAEHDTAVVFRLRPDRNQVLVGSEPVDAVRGQVGIPDPVDVAVGCPTPTADYHKSS